MAPFGSLIPVGPLSRLPQRWLRGKAKIEDDWVVLDGKKVSEYSLGEKTDLLPDLAELGRCPAWQPQQVQQRGPWKQRLLAFVQKHGLLWLQEEWTGVRPLNPLAAPNLPVPNVGPLRNPIEDWQHYNMHFSYTFYGAYHLIRAHHGDSSKVPEQVPALEEVLRQLAHAPSFYSEDHLKSEKLLLEAASQTICSFINFGLMYCPLKIHANMWESHPETTPVGAFSFYYQTQHLLDFAFLETARMLIEKTPVAECEGCGRFFMLKHKRMRYCDEACSNRTRVRRFHQKKADHLPEN